ncbi:MAG: cyclase family protein [Desulfobacteraceae bacterium]|nr:cyclase family protein [Desulfobacteraceae bacterium]
MISGISMAPWKVVDLTHPLDDNIPIWPGDPEFKLASHASYEKDGYLTSRMVVGEHSGTHWGTPNTFIKGGRSADMFTAEELVVPAVVMDIRAIAGHDRDYSLTVEAVTAWERENGRIPRGSVVVLFTGWQERWNDPEAFFGMDGDNGMHWPGFGKDAVDHMIQGRGIAGLGTDTHGTDPGNDGEFKASSAIYGADGMVLECLTGLDRLPPSGTTLVIGGLPVTNGTGSPARVIALLPSKQEIS